MTDDLVGRLRRLGMRVTPDVHDTCTEAAARIEALEAENLRLGRALEAIAEHPGPNADDACWCRVEDARAAIGKDIPHAD